MAKRLTVKNGTPVDETEEQDQDAHEGDGG